MVCMAPELPSMDPVAFERRVSDDRSSESTDDTTRPARAVGACGVWTTSRRTSTQGLPFLLDLSLRGGEFPQEGRGEPG